jgi:hypothetical protein
MKQQEGEWNWGIRSVIIYTEKMCNPQAEASTAKLKVNSKETKELQNSSNNVMYINVNKLVTECLYIRETL